MAINEHRFFLRTLAWIVPLLFGAITLFQVSCTKLQLDALGDRYNDNFSGGLTSAGNVTISNPSSFSFAVLGDTHIGSPSGETMKQIVSKSVTDGDSFVVVAGDITDGGDIGQYRQFTAVMGQYSATYRAAIGNHDIFFNGWDNYKTILGPSIYSFDAGSVHFAMLDSANGVLGIKQLQWLDRDLQATSKTLKVVVSHFPPWEGYFSSMYKMSSDEEAAILKDLLYKNGVQLMFSGHYHGYDEINLGSTKYVVTGGANGIADPGQHKNYVRVIVSGGTMTTTKIEMP